MNQQPWLENKKWAENRILSGAKFTYIVFWVFALVWNALLIPIYLDLSRILDKAKQEPAVYFVALMPIVGIYLVILSIKHTRDWQRTGRTPLTLDPFPGSIGGHLGGSVDTNIRYEANTKGEVTVQCVYSYISGSGKSRTRKESVKWQNKGACYLGQSARGTLFKFRFDVPGDLPESDVKQQSSSYYFWRVTLDIKGTKNKMSRSFVVPVFRTGQTSQSLRQGTESHEETIANAEAGLDRVADFRAVEGGLEAWFAPLRRPTGDIFLALFGAIFVGAGVAAGYFGAPIVFSIVFSLVGTLIFLGGIYGLGKALLVSVTKEGVSTRRFLFRMPINTNHIDRQSFSGFEIKSGGSMQYGGKTTLLYKLVATSSEGLSLTVAERHTSRPEVELIKEKYESAVGVNN